MHSDDSGTVISDITDTTVLNRQVKPKRTIQGTFSGYHPQVSPFMPTKNYDEIQNALIMQNGDEPLYTGQMVFLYATPTTLSETNPPIFQFTFATSKNMITPDEINVWLNGTDLSNDIEYCIHTDNYLNADLYIASFIPDYYLNPKNIQQVNIQFSPEFGEQFQRSFTFEVPDPDNLSVIDANIIWDDLHETPIMNKLWVAVKQDKHVKIADRLKNHINWKFMYEDKSDSPPIQSIENQYDMFYTITFASDFKHDKQILISFSPSEGIFSKLKKIKTPPELIVRDGEAERSVASGTCDDCNGQYELILSIIEPTTCATNHIFELTQTCPEHPNCDGRINESRDIWVYESTPPEMYLQTDVYVLPAIGPPAHEAGQIACQNGTFINDDWSFIMDLQIEYELKGILRNPFGQDCGTLAGPVSDFLQSDVVPPEDSIESSWTINPGFGSTQCETNAKYKLKVTADDLQCVSDNVTFYLVYSDDGNGNIEADEFTLNQFPTCVTSDTHFECFFTIADPNVFACVQYLKIIVFDEKGNWRAKRVYPQT
ncbi:MAG: hypothetical protein ABIG42_11900, partial [bacterium]